MRDSGRSRFAWKRFLYAIALIAVPVALQNLLTTTGSMIDTIMLATLGENAIGAVGLCAQFSSLLFSCYWGFVGGGMLFMAQYWGAGDGEGIRKAYGTTMVFMMSVAMIFMIVTVMFPGHVMSLYTNQKAIQETGVQYLRIVAYAYPLQVFSMAMCAELRSIEQVRIPLYGGIAGVVTNCFVNWLLIFGHLGFPRLEVRGAAIGTIISGLVNLSVVFFLSRRWKIPYVCEVFQAFRALSGSFFREYLGKCFPILCNELLIGVGNMLINIALGHQKAEAIAAVAVFRTLEGIVISFFSGFSNAGSILVGKEVGAGNHELAYQRAVRLVYLCSGFVSCVCLTLIAVHRPLLTVLGLSGESYRIGTGMLLIYSVFAILRMGNWAHNDTFRSAGDAAFGSILEITFMFAMVIPFVYTSNFALHAPFLLVFAFCYIDEPVRYVLMQRHLYSGKWVKPVSESGLASLGDFQKKHGIPKRQKATI